MEVGQGPNLGRSVKEKIERMRLVVGLELEPYKTANRSDNIISQRL
jgi:hypothetical protein